ncbi:MAG: autotransporter domain-containing protein [Endomicrobium sp.]|nr:autotransporter domain-containing protein [Endomicrobium sp.]
MKFADTSSHRIRLGAKLTYEATEVFKPYVGGAFEYEFAGKVDAALAGFDINAPALKGGSGMGEFGVTVNVGKLLIDLGGRCRAGVRTGIEGMLKVKYAIDTRQVSLPSSKSSFSIGDRLLLVNAINTRGGINTATLPAGGLRYITNAEINNIVDSTRVLVVPVYIYHDYPYDCSQIATIYETNNIIDPTLGLGRSACIYRDYSCDCSRRTTCCCSKNCSRRATCCCSKSRKEEREEERQCRSITPYRNSTWY